MTSEELATAGNAALCTSTTAQVHCHGRIIVDSTGVPKTSTTPVGFGPRDLRSAYKISQTGSSSITIAVVDAFGYPNVERDLAVYRSQFGLPACTRASGCLRVVNQTGGTTLPPFDVTWARESALDLQMVSAICPNCRLLLVEANAATFQDLGIAVGMAADLGARVISNSYGGDESFGIDFNDDYDYDGLAVVASTGDAGFGFGVEFPASSQYVTAVGGTTLTRASNTRGWTETAWSGSGAGCSAFTPKPAWQHDTGCANRTIADVSAVADPNTGVAVYAPTSATTSEWMVLGGTSTAAPIIAGAYGLAAAAAGSAASAHYGSLPYAHTGMLFDVKSGTSGLGFCDPTYLCTAGVGYDAPTGLGTPNGAGTP
jgi:subtilase family serine protease